MGYSPASAIPLSSFGAPTANISMNTHKFTSLLDGTTALDSAGWDQLASVAGQYAFVASGCVWTADAPGSTRAASMSAGTVVIGGLLYSVGAITAHTFTASSDTYVDINISAGAAQVVFTTVANNTISPALVSSGTVYTTIRNAVVVTTASAITSTILSINQGNGAFAGGTGITQGSTTVAAGSNGSTIVTTPLNVAASTSFPSGGGWAQVVTNHGTALIQFTGTGAGTLTGVTVLASQSSAITVATGNAVTGVTPVNLTDMLGNLINVGEPFPKVIGYQQFSNSYTTTETAVTPIPNLILPFVVPAGSSLRSIKMSANVPFLASSAAAGNTVSFNLYSANVTGGLASAQGKMSVASDGWPLCVAGIGSLAPGTYYGTCATAAGSAGTVTVSATYLITAMWAEIM